jgi:hypothetical protein
MACKRRLFYIAEGLRPASAAANWHSSSLSIGLYVLSIPRPEDSAKDTNRCFFVLGKVVRFGKRFSDACCCGSTVATITSIIGSDVSVFSILSRMLGSC